MKKISLISALLGLHTKTFACTTCDAQLQAKIYDSTFYPNLLSMLSAFIVLALVVALLSFLSNKSYVRSASATPAIPNPVPLTTASIVLGIGLGGFIDGIVFHQILQFHQMISNKLPPLTYDSKSVNMFWDGIFHLFTLVVVMVAILLILKLFKRKNIDTSGRLLLGGSLMGWGLFNVVEGIINHHTLALHNVKEISQYVDLWNYGFLAVSIVIIIAGYLLTQYSRTNRANRNIENA